MKPPKSKADFRSIVATITPPTTKHEFGGTGNETPDFSIKAIDGAIAKQVGKLDLGPWESIRHRMHASREKGAMARELTTHETKKILEAYKRRVDGEIEILTMHFKRDFSDRIAELSEQAVASQVMVIRKLTVLEGEARNLLFRDLKIQLDELRTMFETGVIDQNDLVSEAQARIGRYDTLKVEFSTLFDEYRNVIKNTYRSA